MQNRKARAKYAFLAGTLIFSFLQTSSIVLAKEKESTGASLPTPSTVKSGGTYPREEVTPEVLETRGREVDEKRRELDQQRRGLEEKRLNLQEPQQKIDEVRYKLQEERLNLDKQRSELDRQRAELD